MTTIYDSLEVGKWYKVSLDKSKQTDANPLNYDENGKKIYITDKITKLDKKEIVFSYDVITADIEDVISADMDMDSFYNSLDVGKSYYLIDGLNQNKNSKKIYILNEELSKDNKNTLNKRKRIYILNKSTKNNTPQIVFSNELIKHEIYTDDKEPYKYEKVEEPKVSSGGKKHRKSRKSSRKILPGTSHLSSNTRRIAVGVLRSRRTRRNSKK